jgi:RNA polymerase sigma factor (sigma-70 family)
MSPRISIRLLATQSDQRLVALAREGHERAFEALVHRYRRPLLRYCRGMRLSDARAEDVLQQAFLQAWMAFARGAEVRDVRPWLYRIAHNVAVNAMRGGGEPHGELTDAAQAQASLSGESNLQRAMDVHDALAGVAALPQMQQQAIFLTAVDGQTHDEVASVLGISEGAVRGLLYRARTTLRSAAAALTPPQLLAWAVGGGAAAPSAERIAELSAGGGAAGLGGLLLKGAVVAVTAGAVATGATVASSDGQGARPQAARAHAVGAAGSAGVAGRTAGTADAPAPASALRGEDPRGRREDRRHGRGRRERSRNGRGKSGPGEDRPASGVPGDADDRRGSTSGSGDGSDGSGGSGGSSGQTASGTSGKGGSGPGSGSGTSGGGSGRSGSDDVQSATDAPVSEQPLTAPVAQPTTTSGGGSDDATAGVLSSTTTSGGSGSSGSGSSGSGSKGGSGSDG